MNPYMLFSGINRRSNQKREAQNVKTTDPVDELLSIFTYKSINIIEHLARSTAYQLHIWRERGNPYSGTGAS